MHRPLFQVGLTLGNPLIGTVYYLPGTTGWSNSFDGVPAVLWNPLIQTADGSFGVRTNQFGFNITGTPNIPIVVQAADNLANPVWTSAAKPHPHQRLLLFQRTLSARHPRPLLPHQFTMSRQP